MFFYKERKRTQSSFRSFIKNRQKRKDRNVLLKRMDAQPCNILHSHPTIPHQFDRKDSPCTHIAHFLASVWALWCFFLQKNIFLM